MWGVLKKYFPIYLNRATKTKKFDLARKLIQFSYNSKNFQKVL